MNARPLQTKSVKRGQKRQSAARAREAGENRVCLPPPPLPSESECFSFGRERTYFFTLYNYVGILSFTRSIPK